MRFTLFLSILLCAALNTSVSHGQEVSDSVYDAVPITDDETTVGACQTQPAADNSSAAAAAVDNSSTAVDNNCKSNNSILKAAHEDTLDEIIYDLVKISTFVGNLANIRRIVKVNEGKTRKKKTQGFFSRSEKYTVAYDTPALILTQDGAQKKNEDKFLKYPITPDAIKLFLEKNRKWFQDGNNLEFDESVTEKTKPFRVEKMIDEAVQDYNQKIIDYNDEFSTKQGGLVYGIGVNLTRKWITVVFRGSIGITDFLADRDFRLDHKSLFESEDDIFIPGGKPGTHKGFTTYLMDEKKGGQDGRKCLDRIIACVNEEFKSNPDVAGKDFNLYVTGHSLGGGLANLLAFKAAQLKAKDDESVKYLPKKITALTFASPVVGNEDYNKEFQYLEKKGNLRHIRVANEGDAVPTNDIIPPFSFFLKGRTDVYTQNGVNLLLYSDAELEVGYRATKTFASQFGPSVLTNHFLATYSKRIGVDLELEANKNKKIYEQTVEELYKAAGDFTN